MSRLSLDITFDWGLPASVVLWSFDNNAEGTMGNPTGEHAFCFNNLRIERPPFGLTGEFNDDGTVDAADYVVWRKTDSGNPQGYADWRENFGMGAGGGSVGASPSQSGVPEPATSVLLMFTAAGWYLRHRRSAKTFVSSGPDTEFDA